MVAVISSNDSKTAASVKHKIVFLNVTWCTYCSLCNVLMVPIITTQNVLHWSQTLWESIGGHSLELCCYKMYKDQIPSASMKSGLELLYLYNYFVDLNMSIDVLRHNDDMRIA